jgi:hypothetical protein
VPEDELGDVLDGRIALTDENGLAEIPQRLDERIVGAAACDDRNARRSSLSRFS